MVIHPMCAAIVRNSNMGSAVVLYVAEIDGVRRLASRLANIVQANSDGGVNQAGLWASASGDVEFILSNPVIGRNSNTLLGAR